MIAIWSVISALITAVLFAVGKIGSVGAVSASLVLCFLGQFFLWATVCVIASLFVDTRKENTKDSRFFRFYAYCIVDILQCVLHYRVNLSGFDQIPDGNFLLISNHRSAFDPIIQLGAFRKYNLGFVSKKENISIPVFGKIMHRCSAVSLDRENPRQATKAILQAAGIIRSGRAAMCIYPEGTRNRGEGLLPLKPGAFKIAQKAECPIVVAVIQNSELIRKNAPLRKTEVCLRVLDVLPADFVREQSTAQLDKIAENIMLSALTSQKSGENERA
ncbi:MAG: lysophospholipid acyltransferase family protein [Eubacteriales bacterium]